MRSGRGQGRGGPSVTEAGGRLRGDVVLAAYLRSRPDPQRDGHAPADSFAYMRRWYRSIAALRLCGRVVHDGLSRGFIDRYAQHRIRFHRVRPCAWSTNDERFFAYHRLLARRPFRRVFLTDIADVRIVQNPFAGLERLGAALVIGDEVYPREGASIRNHAWLMERIRQTRGPGASEVFDFFHARDFDLPTLNAGVIGGPAREVRRFLREFVRVRTAIGHPERNLNMPIVNYVVHRFFEGRFHHGPPVTSRFKFFERRRDVWFIHK